MLRIFISLIVATSLAGCATGRSEVPLSSLNNDCGAHHSAAWCVVEYGSFTDGFENFGKDVEVTRQSTNVSLGSVFDAGVGGSRIASPGRLGMPIGADLLAGAILVTGSLKGVTETTVRTGASFNHVCAMMPKEMAASLKDAAYKIVDIIDQGMISALPDGYSGKSVGPDPQAESKYAKNSPHVDVFGPECRLGCYIFTPRDGLTVELSKVPEWAGKFSAKLQPGNEVWTVCSAKSKYFMYQRIGGFEDYPFSAEEFHQRLSTKLPDWMFVVVGKHEKYGPEMYHQGKTHPF